MNGEKINMKNLFNNLEKIGKLAVSLILGISVFLELIWGINRYFSIPYGWATPILLFSFIMGCLTSYYFYRVFVPKIRKEKVTVSNKKATKEGNCL